MAFPPSQSQIYCILFLSYFSKRQIKRFGDPASTPEPLGLALTRLIFYTCYPLLFSGKLIIIDKDRCGNLKYSLKFPYHINGQSFLSVKYFGNTAFPANYADQVLLAHIEFLHSDFDSFYRIGCIDWIVLIFVVLDQ